jgi:hypothetical protein
MENIFIIYKKERNDIHQRESTKGSTRNTKVSFDLTFLGLRNYLKAKNEIRAFRKKLKLFGNCCIF